MTDPYIVQLKTWEVGFTKTGIPFSIYYWSDDPNNPLPLSSFSIDNIMYENKGVGFSVSVRHHTIEIIAIDRANYSASFQITPGEEEWFWPNPAPLHINQGDSYKINNTVEMSFFTSSESAPVGRLTVNKKEKYVWPGNYVKYKNYRIVVTGIKASPDGDNEVDLLIFYDMKIPVHPTIS